MGFFFGGRGLCLGEKGEMESWKDEHVEPQKLTCCFVKI